MNDEVRCIQDLDVRGYVRAATRQGWRFKLTNSGHWKLWHPTDAAIMVYGTCNKSDHRKAKNVRAQLRRAGVDV